MSKSFKEFAGDLNQRENWEVYLAEKDGLLGEYKGKAVSIYLVAGESFWGATFADINNGLHRPSGFESPEEAVEFIEASR